MWTENQSGGCESPKRIWVTKALDSFKERDFTACPGSMRNLKVTMDAFASIEVAMVRLRHRTRLGKLCRTALDFNQIVRFQGNQLHLTLSYILPLREPYTSTLTLQFADDPKCGITSVEIVLSIARV